MLTYLPLVLTTNFQNVSFRLEPEAFAIDAFSLDWSNLNICALPLFSVIPKVLSKLKCEGAMGGFVCCQTGQHRRDTRQLFNYSGKNQYTSKQGNIYFSCPAVRRKL